MRLDQFLVKSNICSRSEAKQYIKKGRVTVDGKSMKDSALHIDENSAKVELDGVPVIYAKFRYYMLNKPAGVVSATKDSLSETVTQLLKDVPVKGLFPVGRLDKDTEGLLLITDDGALAHKLLSPKRHVDKIYYVEASTSLSEYAMKMMEEGVDIGDDKITLPASVCKCDKINSEREVNNGNCYLLTIHEGRFHQVKRMFEACGSRVEYLKRISMGTLTLDEELKPGEYRPLNEEEIERLIG